MRQLLPTLSFLFLVATVSVAQEPLQPPELKVGAPAPDFALPYATKDTIVLNAPVSLSELIGKRNIVLAFYPADWSEGCTKEMCTLRDEFADLENLDAEILPISGDYVFSHKEWAKYHRLPFKLLSDHDHAVAKKYHSYNDMTGWNRRTVYVIDKTGRIAYMNLKYDVRTPDSFSKLKEVLSTLK